MLKKKPNGKLSRRYAEAMDKFAVAVKRILEAYEGDDEGADADDIMGMFGDDDAKNDDAYSDEDVPQDVLTDEYSDDPDVVDINIYDLKEEDFYNPGLNKSFHAANDKIFHLDQFGNIGVDVSMLWLSFTGSDYGHLPVSIYGKSAGDVLHQLMVIKKMLTQNGNKGDNVPKGIKEVTIIFLSYSPDSQVNLSPDMGSMSREENMHGPLATVVRAFSSASDNGYTASAASKLKDEAAQLKQAIGFDSATSAREIIGRLASYYRRNAPKEAPILESVRGGIRSYLLLNESLSAGLKKDVAFVRDMLSRHGWSSAYAEAANPLGRYDQNTLLNRYCAGLVLLGKKCPQSESDVNKLKAFKKYASKFLSNGGTVDQIKKKYAEIKSAKPERGAKPANESLRQRLRRGSTLDEMSAANPIRRTIDGKNWHNVQDAISRHDWSEDYADGMVPLPRFDQNTLLQRYVAALKLFNKPCPASDSDVDQIGVLKAYAKKFVENGGTYDQIRELYDQNDAVQTRKRTGTHRRRRDAEPAQQAPAAQQQAAPNPNFDFDAPDADETASPAAPQAPEAQPQSQASDDAPEYPSYDEVGDDAGEPAQTSSAGADYPDYDDVDADSVDADDIMGMFGDDDAQNDDAYSDEDVPQDVDSDEYSDDPDVVEINLYQLTNDDFYNPELNKSFHAANDKVFELDDEGNIGFKVAAFEVLDNKDVTHMLYAKSLGDAFEALQIYTAFLRTCMRELPKPTKAKRGQMFMLRIDKSVAGPVGQVRTQYRAVVPDSVDTKDDNETAKLVTKASTSMKIKQYGLTIEDVWKLVDTGDI